MCFLVGLEQDDQHGGEQYRRVAVRERTLIHRPVSIL